MKKGILIIVGAVFAIVLIRMFIIIVILLSTPHGELHKQGLITGHKGDWVAAIAHFDKVIEMNPHHEKAYTTRAFAKSQLGDQQGAIDDTTIALQKYPFYGRAYAIQGLAEFRAGDKELGCKDMQQAYDLGFEQAKEYINQYCN